MSSRMSFSRPLVCIYFYVLLPHCSIIDFRDESRFDHSKDWISIVLCSWSGFPSELIKGLPTYFTFFVVEHCEGAVSLPWLLIFYAGTLCCTLWRSSFLPQELWYLIFRDAAERTGQAHSSDIKETFQADSLALSSLWGFRLKWRRLVSHLASFWKSLHINGCFFRISIKCEGP